MPISDIAKAVYAPQKVFKEIVQNPKYLAPALVLILFVAAQFGASYAVLSKSYIEQSQPTGQNGGDIWTENATFWTANTGVAITNNHTDFINGTYYGNSSIQFDASNMAQISAKIVNLGQMINCGLNGFQNLSFRVNLVAPQAKPENVSLFLYSLSSSSFYYDMTDAFSNSTIDVWNNITVPVGHGNWASSSSSANWENITGLEMDFTWANNSNITLRIDGLFFRGLYKTPLESDSFSYLSSAVLSAFTTFVLRWLVLTGLIYVLIKVFKGTVNWKPIMVAVGIALIVTAIQAVITIGVAEATLPNIYYPLEYFAGVPGEATVAAQNLTNTIALFYNVSIYIQIAIYAWIFALNAIIVRAITAFNWGRTVVVSAASLLLTIIIGLLLGF